MKILVVDDLKDNLELLVFLLTSSGYEIKSASNGKEALEILHSEPMDLIISDILMPVMDGFTLCRECKKDKELSEIPFIFYTATYTTTNDEEFALALGADKFIKKPAEPEDFLKIIKDVIQNTESKRFKAKKPIIEDEKEVLKLYNERLVNKLEKKMLDLEKSELKYRNLYENVNDMIFSLDENGYFIAINCRIKLFGYKAEEMIGEHFTSLLPPNNRQFFLDRFEQVKIAKDNLQNVYETEIIKKDNTLAIAELSISTIYKDEEFIGRFGIARDITKRKKAEKDLKESEEKFRVLYNNSPDMYVSVSPIDATIMFCNDTLLNVTGYTREDIIGATIFKIYDPSCFDEVKKAFQQFIETGIIRDTELIIKRKNGEILDVSLCSDAVRNEEGKILYSISSWRDITLSKQVKMELIKAKEHAEESDRLKTSFLHNISHEIRTPMNSIVGFSNLLIDPELLPEKQKYFVEIINQSSEQLLSIISDLVSIATIEAGQAKIEEREFELNKTLRLLHDELLLKVKNPNISLNLSLSLPDNEDLIISDETKLIQILTNLIGNAIKFTDNGYVNFSYQVKENELEFLVEDSGIGIPIEMQKSIFNRFHQGDSTTINKFGGAGLGLSISKAYIELLGGKVWLISELNKGSKFFFTIPYKKALMKSGVMPSNNGNKIEIKQTKTILIVEDEDFNFNLLQELLSSSNLKIIRALNGAEAIEKCKSHQRIDLVLMDIKMPIMDGFDATKQILEFMPHLPIIAETAYSTDADKAKAMESGCIDFLSKPINHQILIAKIRKQLEKV